MRVLRENCAYLLTYTKRADDPVSIYRIQKIIVTRANSKRSEIRTINFVEPTDKARHDRMVSLVTQMLDLNKKFLDARLEQEKTMLSRQIEATDASIDKLVYELYGLTEEEINVVEGATGKW
ncbi:MAG: hypothetical protein STSR0009_05260 [Methanoregula sp.]